MQHNYRLGNQDYTIYGISQLLISCSWSRTTSRSVRSAKRHSETYCFWPYLLHRYGVQTLNLCASVYVWLQWMWGGFGYQLHISIKSIATNVYLGNRKLTSRFRVQVNSKWSVLPPFWTHVCITSFFCDDTCIPSWYFVRSPMVLAFRCHAIFRGTSCIEHSDHNLLLILPAISHN